MYYLLWWEDIKRKENNLQLRNNEKQVGWVGLLQLRLQSPEWPSDHLNNPLSEAEEACWTRWCSLKRPPSTTVQFPAISTIARKCYESLFLGLLISRPPCFGVSPISLEGQQGHRGCQCNNSLHRSEPPGAAGGARPGSFLWISSSAFNTILPHWLVSKQTELERAKKHSVIVLERTN